MKVADLTAALETMPQEANILGVFVQRVGEMDATRLQEYKVRIVAEMNGVKSTIQFEYAAYVQEKRDNNAPLKQSPFSGISSLFK